MTKRTLALAIYLAGTAAYAGQPQEKLTVYVKNTAMVSSPDLMYAEAVATKMFSSIGVTVQWRSGKPAGDFSLPPVYVEFVTGTPADRKPGALAFALPYEGSHLTVFYDRIKTNFFPRSLLAHVLVHEITHLLEGVDRHSVTGVMKAHWNTDEYLAMRMGTLPFAPEDVELIHDGLTGRARRLVATATR